MVALQNQNEQYSKCTEESQLDYIDCDDFDKITNKTWQYGTSFKTLWPEVVFRDASGCAGKDTMNIMAGNKMKNIFEGSLKIYSIYCQERERWKYRIPFIYTSASTYIMV